MFILYANKTQLNVRKREPVTSGSVGVFRAAFTFSPDWDGLDRTAVFRAGHVSRSVILDGEGPVIIPWEVLETPGVWLECGVYGKEGDTIVLPTVWTQLGYIQKGASPGPESRPPTPELWEQALAGKGDALGYTDSGELGLYSGETLLSSVPVAGGEGGVSDHRLLTGRDADGQHPIASISGLEAELNRIPEPVEALTNSELEEMLK